MENFGYNNFGITDAASRNYIESILQSTNNVISPQHSENIRFVMPLDPTSNRDRQMFNNESALNMEQAQQEQQRQKPPVLSVQDDFLMKDAKMVMHSTFFHHSSLHLFFQLVSSLILWVFLWITDIVSLFFSYQRYRLIQDFDGDEFQDFDDQDTSDYVLKILETCFSIIFKFCIYFYFEVSKFTFYYIPCGMLIYVVVRLIFVISKKLTDNSPLLNDAFSWGFKMFFAAQIFLISLKYESAIDWKWRDVFWAYWVFFSIMVGVNIGFIIILFSKCYAKCSDDEIDGVEIKGLFWLFLLSNGLTVSSTVFISSLVDFLDHERREEIWFSFQYSTGFILILFAFTIWNYKEIMYFKKITKEEEGEQNEELEQDNQEEQEQQNQEQDVEDTDENKKKEKKKKVRKIKINNEISKSSGIPLFLNKLSSTYFKSMTHNPNKLKQQKDQKEQKKKKIQQVKKSASFMIHRNAKYNQNEEATNTKNKKPEIKEMNDLEISFSQNRQQFQQQQQNNDEKNSNNPLKQMAIQTNQQFKLLMASPRSLALLGYDLQHPQFFESKKNKQFHTPPPSPGHKKEVEKEEKEQDSNCISDIKLSSRKEQKSFIFNNNDKSINVNNLEQSNINCVICFDLPPDAVYMPCGHGGICYNCALDILKKSGECYLCRQLLQLDLANRQGKNIKVLALATLVDDLDSTVKDATDRERNNEVVHEHFHQQEQHQQGQD